MPAGTHLSCLEFRRNLLEDPRRLGAAAVEHGKTCAACAGFAAQLMRLESELALATCVPVPDGLADRVLLKLGLSNARNWLALAASLVLAVGLTVLITLTPVYKDPALAAIDHVRHEEAQELLTGRTGDHRMLAPILAQAGLSVPAAHVGVHYLGQCPFRGGIAYHVMLDTPFGKATLLVTPDRPLNFRIVAAERGLSAAAIPARRGSYTLVADSSKDLVHIERLLESPAL